MVRVVRYFTKGAIMHAYLPFLLRGGCFVLFSNSDIKEPNGLMCSPIQKTKVEELSHGSRTEANPHIVP